MSRARPWRNKPPVAIQQLIPFALESRFYVVREPGPTAFVLKGDDSRREFKVQIGGEQSCSCKTNPELCIHILFVMLKVYRIPSSNPIVWQTALVDDEIAKILSGRMQRQVQAAPVPKGTAFTRNAPSVTRKPVDDVCPICYDDMSESDALVWCRHGCGGNVHGACMKVWESHHKEHLTCPLCRSEWGPLIIPKVTKKRPVSKNVHQGIRCTACNAMPIVGARYRCTQCTSVDLCASCFGDPLTHGQHAFEGLDKEGGIWNAAPRTTRGGGLTGHGLVALGGRHMPLHSHEEAPTTTRSQASTAVAPLVHLPSLQGVPTVQNEVGGVLSSSRTEPLPDVRDLLYREILPEDYDRLLQLDANVRRHPILTSAEVQAIPMVDVRELLQEGREDLSCAICQSDFEIGEMARCLPECGHLFHLDCIETWLTKHRNTCPVDGRQVEVDPVALLERQHSSSATRSAPPTVTTNHQEGPQRTTSISQGSMPAGRQPRSEVVVWTQRQRRLTAPPAPRQPEPRGPSGHVPTVADLNALAVGPGTGAPILHEDRPTLATRNMTRPLQGALRAPRRTVERQIPPPVIPCDVEPRGAGGAINGARLRARRTPVSRHSSVPPGGMMVDGLQPSTIPLQSMR